LIRSLDPALPEAMVRALAKLSFSVPHNPLGSAAVTAMPDIITLSSSSFHSSAVKSVLAAMGGSPREKGTHRVPSFSHRTEAARWLTVFVIPAKRRRAGIRPQNQPSRSLLDAR
jgi:hypothetical protein